MSEILTGMEQRWKVVEQMRSYIGLNEGDGSCIQILDTYNQIDPLPQGYRLHPGEAWCAATVSAAGAACGMSDILYPECSCPRMIDLYKAHNRWMERDDYRPLPGDVVFYHWKDSGRGDCQGTANHVGLVDHVEGTIMTIIEGNMAGGRCGTRPLEVNGRYIRGFGLPDYERAGQLPPYELEIRTMPEWAQGTVRKLAQEKKVLTGDGHRLDLSRDLMRVLVILDRSGAFDVDQRVYDALKDAGVFEA